MTCESDAAGVWAALLGLSFFIAVTLTVGYWLCVYHNEAREMQPFLIEPRTAIDLIWEDIPVVGW